MFKFVLVSILALSAMVSWAQPVLPTTPYTFRFMTNRTAAEARDYLDIDLIAGGASNAINNVNGTTNAQQRFQATTNNVGGVITVTTNGAGAINTNSFNFPYAGPAVSGPLHSNDFQNIIFASEIDTWAEYNAINTDVDILTSAFSTNAFRNVWAVTNAQQLTNAIAAAGAVQGGEIHLSSGFFNLDNGVQIWLTNGIKLIGQGQNATVLNVRPISGQISGILLTNDSTVLNMSLTVTNTDRNVGIFACVGGTNVYLGGLDCAGITDVIFGWTGGKARFVNSRFTSKWDAMVHGGGEIEQFNCHWVVRPFASAVGVVNIDSAHGSLMSGGTNIMYGGSIITSGGRLDNIGIAAATANCRVELYGVTFGPPSPIGVSYSVTNHPSAVVIMENCMASSATMGPITNQIRLPAVIGSYGQEQWSVSNVVGRYTNNANDRYVFFDTSSVAGTNTLPDIGFRSTINTAHIAPAANNDTYVFNGVTYTWKDSPSGAFELQVTGSEAIDAVILVGTLQAAIDGRMSADVVNDTNVVITSMDNQMLTVSATGTWFQNTVSSNDFPVAEGRLITVKDKSGSAGTRNITVFPRRNAKIDGASSYVINHNYGGATFQAIGTNWAVISTVTNFSAGAGSGDVTAAANFDTDNAVIRADGTGKGVQKSGVSINDTNGLSVPGGAAFHEVVSSNGVTAANFTGTGSGAAGMRLFDTAGTEYIGLLSPSDVTASYQLRPPAAIATAGFLLAGAVSSSISDVSVVAATSDGLVGAITGEEGTAGGLTRATGATHDQTKVGFSGALGTDDTYNGDQITGTQAGETVAQWELVRMHSDGQFHLADADAAGEFPARGLAVAATSDNTAITVLTQGTVRNDTWNWTVGGTLYLSTTAGGLTQTAPSTSGNAVQVVGFAISADIAYFNFTGHYLEVQ